MLRRFAKLVWASPCSLVGLTLAVIVLMAGGKAKRQQGTLEVVLRNRLSHCGSLTKSLPFRGITFGHIILAVTDEELVWLRAHERVHVRQYESWGILFFPAYLASSLWQLIRGRKIYWDNYFEVQAREQSQRGKEMD